jgi:hypothetical protein
VANGSVNLSGRVVDSSGAAKVGLQVDLYTLANYETMIAGGSNTITATYSGGTDAATGRWNFDSQALTETWVIQVTDGLKKYAIDADNDLQLSELDLVTSLNVNTIYEHTSGSGVTIDGVLIKDGIVTSGGNVLPSSDDTYDLGSATYAWQDLFLEGDITLTDAGSLFVADNSATAFQIMQGSDAYLTIDTANSSESVSIGTGISGTTVTLGHGTSTVAVTDNMTVGGDITVTGTTTLNGSLVLGDAAADTLTIGATLQGATPLIFEGANAGGDNDHETSFAITDPTADRTITFPDATLTVNAAANISGTTLASNVVTSSLTTVGVLNAGSINTSFGTINNAAAITGTVLTATTNFTLGDTVVTDGVITDSTGLSLAADVTVTGDLTVSGTTTTIDSSTLTVVDPLVKYGQDYEGSGWDQGFIVTRGDGAGSSNTQNMAFIWDESEDEFATIKAATEAGTTAGNVTITDYVDLRVGGITADDASTFSTSITLASGATVTGIDNGALGSSATLLATQGAIKTYVDSVATAADLDFQGDTGGALSIDLDSETLDIAGGTGIATVGGTNTVTVNIDSTVATLTGSQILTNKTLTAPTLTTPALGTPASGVMTNMTGAVTASIGDDQITLDKMANLARGNIIVGDSGGNPVALGVGSDTHVLTINGSGDAVWAATTGSDTTYTAGDGLDLSGTTFSTDLMDDGGLEITGSELSVAQGISEHDVAQFAASVANDDFLRIAGTAVEGLSAAEVAAAIELEIDAVGTIAQGVWNGTAIANANLANSALTITAGAGMTGGGSTALGASSTLNVIAGSGMTVNAGDIAITAAQTAITTLYNTSLKVGRDAHNQFDFATDNEIKVSVNAVDDEFRFVAGGNFHADADVFAYSSTTASDRNIKKNIVEISDALSKVQALHGVTFDYKEEHRGSSVGLIAQDVQALYPELVTQAPKLGTDDEAYLSLNYNGVIGLLVEAVKELAEEVRT